MTNWDTLKAWLETHASVQTDLSAKIVLEYMEELEKDEKSFAQQLAKEGMKRKMEQEGFLYTGVPDFDQKSWQKILEERGLQGLA